MSLKPLKCSLVLLFILIGFGKVSYASSIAHHQINLSIDLGKKRIVGADSIVLEVSEPEVPFRLANGISISSIKSGSNSLEFSKMEQKEDHGRPEEGSSWTGYLLKVPAGSVGKEMTVTFEYEGSYPSIDFEKDKRHYGLEVGGYLNDRSGLLLENAYWYPEIQGQKRLFTYQLTVRLEKGLALVSSGTRTEKNDEFEFKMDHPTDQINVVFGPYHITRAKYKDIEISTYFTQNDPDMAEAYLDKMKEYLKRDEIKFGNYPYKTLAVVDSPIMVGLGFPEFTLIGEKLLTIPDMINTSLGHEILHNWYGSGIYVTPGSGNWTEGLVTYLADHQYNLKQNGEAISRMELLKQYTVATRGKPEKSLNQVGDDDASEDRAVSYYKSTMIFSMLVNQIGSIHFFNGLRTFTKEKMYHAASWDDFKKAFEAESGQNLEPFFKQWVYGKGAPQVTIKEEKNSPHILMTPFSMAFTIHTDPPFQFDLPIEVQTETGIEKKTVSITKPDEKVFMLLSSPAQEIRVDPTYKVMRRLNDNELPANISIVLETSQELTVLFSKSLGKETRELYEHFLKISEIKFHEIQELKQTSGPVVLLGPPDSDQKIGGWDPKDVPWHWQKDSLDVAGGSIRGGDESAVLSWYGPAGYSQPIVWIVGYSKKGLNSLAQRLGYYMPWSYVLFRDGKSVV
ncbi:MAG: M1 family metallopeptidase, partial [Nitrospiria bacterium]